MNALSAIAGIRETLDAIETKIKASDAVKLVRRKTNRKPSVLKIKEFLALISTGHPLDGSSMQAQSFQFFLGLDRSGWCFTRSHADNMNLIRRVGERRAAHYTLTQKGKNLLKSLS